MPENTPSIPRVLTIAGSDSGGGAGIQADLKTCTALGVYGMSAITSITAQNTVAVTAIHDLPPDVVAKQIDAVAQDIGVDAAKTGMLSSAAIIEAVADAIERNAIPNLVIDPVMVAKSGDALLRESARQALITKLLPHALILTPNIPEAEVIAGCAIGSPDDVPDAAKRILDLGPQYVLMKGGHLEGHQATDYLFSREGQETYTATRFDTPNTHGTGCTYSAAIAAHLALGHSPRDAIQRAKDYLTRAIEENLDLGAGHGPLKHYWTLQH
jgi:hydroxymethylpyrimidine/phosphomethylpyrimidine kinase